MATRTNIIVRGGDFRITLYRHWDGYPAETGAHLLEVVRAAPRSDHPDTSASAADIATRLVRHTHTGNYDGAKPMHLYEITTEIHGDIEHLYIVKFTNRAGVEIGHTPIEIGSDRDPSDLYQSATWYTPGEFEAMVNNERRAVNARARARGLTNAYPMIGGPA